MPCNTGRMGRPAAEQELRELLAEGLARLNAARGGRYLSRVAATVGVERSTVSRWQRQQATAGPTHCELLARQWPEYFDGARLADLHYRALELGGVDGPRTVGADVLTSTAEIYGTVTSLLADEPAAAQDRVYRHVAFHIDRQGTDPAEADPLFDEPARASVQAYRTAVSARAAAGWQVQFVLSAGNVSRLASIEQLVASVDGPDVEVFAYPTSLPLTMAPVVVANSTVVLAHDHRRFERPGSALVIRARSVADWATRYIADLVAEAPFRLRSPRGPDRDGLAAFAAALEARRAERQRWT